MAAPGHGEIVRVAGGAAFFLVIAVTLWRRWRTRGRGDVRGGRSPALAASLPLHKGQIESLRI